MDYLDLNKSLKDLNTLERNLGKPLEIINHDTERGEKFDVGYDQTVKIYRLPDSDKTELFLKVTFEENSYGGEDLIRGIEFVKGKLQQILTFE